MKHLYFAIGIRVTNKTTPAYLAITCGYNSPTATYYCRRKILEGAANN